ncbi:MAG: ABC transporter permease [Bacteroidota bacterium]
MIFSRILQESFLFAWHSLTANKLRSFLSLLGITIGIFAIITVFTIVDSLEKNVRNSVASLGENVVFIQKWPWEFGGEYPWWKYMNRPKPKLEELDDVTRVTQLADATAFVTSLRKTVKFESNSIDGADLNLVSHNYDKVRSFDIAQGRYFTDHESGAGRSVALIGESIAGVLFGSLDPIGKKIKILGRKVTVIGVFAREGSSVMGNSADNLIVIPVNFGKTLVDLKGERGETMIMVKARDGIKNEDLKSELTGVMRAIRKLKPLETDDFALNETKMLSKSFDSIFSVIGLAGWIIGGFSIIVGGFGIANIMFVSVKERTSMIGIQKSLGAKNYFILLQFLIEAILLSFVGGLIGLLLVYLITYGVSQGFDMDMMLSKSNMILGLTISILIGLISGFIPAYSASQLDPVEAIRQN